MVQVFFLEKKQKMCLVNNMSQYETIFLIGLTSYARI